VFIPFFCLTDQTPPPFNPRLETCDAVPVLQQWNRCGANKLLQDGKMTILPKVVGLTQKQFHLVPES
jgi:hypothetical protein